MPHSRSTVAVKVLIANKEIEWPFKSLKLQQSAFEHHEIAVTVALDIEGAEEKQLFLSINDFQNALGKSLTVRVEPQDEYVDAGELLEFVGIISNVTFENSVEKINQVTFHAKSPTWMIDKSKINHFWKDEGLKSIVDTVVGKYSVEKGDVKLPSVTFPFLVQFGETDWDFLCRICRRENRWVYYDGIKLHIGTAKSKNTHSIDWQRNIGEFDLKMNIGQLDYKADVYYDSDSEKLSSDSTKAAVSTDFSKLTKKSHDVSKSDFKDKSADDFPVHTDAEDKVKKYLFNKKQAAIGQLVKCSVQSNVPAIKVGDTVKIERMKDFVGTYFVDSVTHIVEEGNRYYNKFIAIPLEIASPSWKAPTIKIPPMQVGVVTDNKDPESRARVKVKLYYTDEKDSQLETPFLRTVTHHAGNGYGTYFLPDIGDEVLVGFERGNPEMPMVLGNVWNGQVKPDNSVVDNDNNFKAIYTKGGNRIDIGDKSGSETIKITNADKNSIVLDCSGPLISIKTDGDVAIEATKNISVKAGENLKIEAGKDIEIKAGSNYKLDAAQNLEEKGGMNSKYTAGMKMESSAMDMNISGATKVTVQGAVIQLN